MLSEEQRKKLESGMQPIHWPEAPPKPSRQPRLIRWLQRFMLPTDRGLGDTAERWIASAGGRKIKAQLEKLGVNCGCSDRQKWLNDRYPNPDYSGQK